MPDEQKELDDTNHSDAFLPDDLDSDWGEAWESAFEAEDDDVSTSEDDLQDDFFINEDERTAGTLGSSLTAASKSSSSEFAAETAEPSETVIGLKFTAALAAVARFLSDFLSQFTALLPAVKQRLHALSTRQKLLVGGGIGAMLCIAVIVSFFSGPDEPAVSDMSPPSSSMAQQESRSSSLPAAEYSETTDGVSDTGEVSAMLPEKVRKKWPFPDFFIPVASQSGDKDVSFLIVDLTLVAVLDNDEELPEDREAFVRDIIYQFYTNRPLFELRRYSLARGDMSRELRSWLHKQWPEGPIESIVFNKYQLT